jgi:uncharacterized protein YbdZ (MbtH family)
MDVLRKMRSKKGLLAAACALLLLVGLAVLVALRADGPDGPGASAGGSDGPFCADTGDYTVCTDQADYDPGATVHVSGSGFVAGSSLTMKVTRPDGSVVTGDGSFAAWPTAYDAVIVGDDGTLRYDYVLDGIEGDYLVEVLDADGTLLAIHTFSDCWKKIIIKKVTVPGGDSQTFVFTGDVSGTLRDGQTAYKSVSAGTYTSTETVPSGWALTKIECSDKDSYGDIGTGTATFKLGWCEDKVKCTFTNTKLGRIIIDKVTDPAGDPQSFGFSLTGGPSGLNQSFSLTDAAAPYDSGAILPGSGYKAAETVPAGWDLTSATCDDGSPINNISVSPGETVTCTFRDKKQWGRIIVDKVTVPGGDPQSFQFNTDYGSPFSLTDAATPKDSGPLSPGTYSVSEAVPAGWDLTGASCDDGSPVSAIVLGAGEEVKCTFTNTKRGRIIVDKVTVPGGDPQSFNFTTNYGSPFSLTDAAAPNDSGPLWPGTYSVSETVPAGWDLTSATCDDGSPVSAIVLGAGETVKCTFTNTSKVTVFEAVGGIVDIRVDGSGSALNSAAGSSGGSVASYYGALSAALAAGAMAVAAGALYARRRWVR